MGFENPLSRGEEMRRRAMLEGPRTVPVETPIVQILLAQRAFPESSDPLTDWIAQDYARAFDGYRTTHAGEAIDIRSPEALDMVLKAIKGEPPTLH